MNIAKRDPVPIYARLGLIGSFLSDARRDAIPEELIASTMARAEFTTMMKVRLSLHLRQDAMIFTTRGWLAVYASTLDNTELSALEAVK